MKRVGNTFRYIGAQNLLFIPGGTMHPMLFLEKLETYFEDAGVPDKAKVRLAINCLRSSAADWVANKEASFSSYDIFKDMFKKRYWGEDEERQLFYSIKYGVYNGGNKADYILKLASQVSRKEDNGRDRARNREDEGNRRYVRGQDQGREQTREVRTITNFSTNMDDMLSDDEEVLPVYEFKSPVFRADILGNEIDILVDSGSQVSAISEDFLVKIQSDGRNHLPVLPVTNTSLSFAAGTKSQKIKQQVLLPIKTGYKRFDMIYMVVPKLNRAVVILGCDWLAKGKVRMDFDNMNMFIPNLNVLLKLRFKEGAESDNDTQFQSGRWVKGLKELGVECLHTSEYFPQGNITERVNREIGRMLRAFCHTKHTKWAFMLDEVESCLNSVIHESTGFAPILLHLGIKPTNNIHKIVDFPPEPPTNTDVKSVWVLALENLKNKEKKRRDKHDQSNQLTTFNIGDAVLVRQHPQSSAENSIIKKFCLLFEGPYFVSKIVGPNCYEISDVNGVCKGRQNIVNLKRYICAKTC
nr:unnamed protein product [Callosobruchus analis]